MGMATAADTSVPTATPHLTATPTWEAHGAYGAYGV